MQEGRMDEAVTRDIIQTLYGVDTDTIKKPADAPDKLFEQRMELTMSFTSGDADGMYMVNMNLPFGRVQATTEEFEALRGRLAVAITEKIADGKTYRPASLEETMAFYDRMEQMVHEAAMEKFLANAPKEGMYQA